MTLKKAGQGNELLGHALRYRETGLSIIPVDSDKVPLINSWTPFQKRLPSTEEIHSFFEKSVSGLAAVCGEVSGNLEVIDIDTKYDLSGNLVSDFSLVVKKLAPGLLDRVLIQKSESGGWHLWYKCERIGRNEKLATRQATPEEQANGEKIKGLIETRGEGGFVVAEPTPGYEVKKGQSHGDTHNHFGGARNPPFIRKST